MGTPVRTYLGEAWNVWYPTRWLSLESMLRNAREKPLSDMVGFGARSGQGPSLLNASALFRLTACARIGGSRSPLRQSRAPEGALAAMPLRSRHDDGLQTENRRGGATRGQAESLISWV